MPRNGAGAYSLPTGNPVVTGTAISSTVQNNTMTDVATALTQSLAKDGQTTPSANLPMGSFRHTGVGNGVARTDYPSIGQVQDSSFMWCGTATGTANALLLVPTPIVPAIVAGQRLVFKSGAAPNSGATTVSISTLPAIAVQVNVAACAGGEILANSYYEIVVDASLTSCQLNKIGRATLAELGAVAKAGDTMTGALTMTAVLNEAHGADIASAATINLTTATGNLVDVTGTVAITAVTLADGAERTVRFTGILTLTNGASLVLPGAANITTAAGDFAVFRGYAAGVVRCVDYSRADGSPITVPLSKLSAAAANSGYPQSGTGGETLRTIRGNVSGAGVITAGSGFTITKVSTGFYQISFTTPFSAKPSVTLCVFALGYQIFLNGEAATTAASVLITSFAGASTDNAFNFIATGPA